VAEGTFASLQEDVLLLILKDEVQPWVDEEWLINFALTCKSVCFLNLRASSTRGDNAVNEKAKGDQEKRRWK
jgi:hypothetical protein